MKTLLAIINEPKDSKDFIQSVAEMGIALNTNVHLLYAESTVNYPMGITGSSGVAVAQAQQSTVAHVGTVKKILAKHVEDVKSKLSSDIFIDFSANLGETYQIVRDLVSENKVHMVILEEEKVESFWTHSLDNLNIIENLDCPVWIVPPSWYFKPFAEIIYATDYKEEDITGLKRLIELVRSFSPGINALHITNSVDFEEKVKKAGFLEVLKSQVTYNQLTVRALSDNSNSDVTELLNGYAKLVKADLIVVTKENKNFFERIFKTDPAMKIIKSTSLPVLVYHEKA